MGKETEEIIEKVNTNIPEDLKKIKDCWYVALSVICIITDIDYRHIFRIPDFSYDRNDEPKNLAQIIDMHMKINFTDASVTVFERVQDDLVKNILNLNIRYFRNNYNNTTIIRELVNTNKNKLILWFDTYDCKWNPMYQKKHVLHCVAAIVIDENYLVFDTLLKDFQMEINISEMNKIVKYVFWLEKADVSKEFNIGLEKDKITSIISNLEKFLQDLYCLKNKMEKDETINTRENKELFVRIFRNQAEKYHYLVEYAEIPKLDIEFIKEIEELWDIAGVYATRVCFSKEEKRKINYEKLCETISSIISNIKEFINIKNNIEEKNDII